MKNIRSPIRQTKNAAKNAGDARLHDRRHNRRDYSDLDLPECLFIKSIRLWLHGPENWQLIGIQYQAHFGPGLASVALLALKSVIEIINTGARRPLAFHRVWSRRSTGDERSLIALLAACQAGDDARSEALAGWLVHAPVQALLLDQIETLAAAFSKKGHRFVHLSPRHGPRDKRKAGPIRRMDDLLDAGD